MPKFLLWGLNHQTLTTTASYAQIVTFKHPIITLLFCYVQAPVGENYCINNSCGIKKKPNYFLLISDRGAKTQEPGTLMSYRDSLNTCKRKNTSKGEMKDKTVN